MNVQPQEVKQEVKAPLENARLDLEPAAVSPGTVEQMHAHVDRKCRVLGVVLDPGFVLVRVIAGRHRWSPSEGGPFPSLDLEPGTYFTVLVKAEDSIQETTVCHGYIELDGPAPAKVDVRSATIGPGFSVQPRGGSVAPPLVERKAPLTPGPSTVTPGVNEVAVLLTRGEAERLIQAINGYPITAGERPGLLRRFNQALGR